MPDEIVNSSSSSAGVASRPKAHRNSNSSTTASSTPSGTIRRSSPSNEQNGDGRPPTKRARKAINCDPCRSSKLKCDRNRPCSSCVLRGTSALCYQDGRGFDDSASRGDDLQYARIDPAQEINRLRHSINLLEAYIFPASRNQHLSNRRQSDSSLIPKKEDIEPDVNDKAGAGSASMTAPGVLGSKGQGALYAGSTSVLNFLAMPDSRRSEESDSKGGHSSDTQEDRYTTPEYDRDLLAMLPPIETIDELISFYFDFCNWIYRHVNQTSFTSQWTRFKSGTSADRIVLATACAMIAVATFYLPSNHHLLQSLPETHEEIGLKFYDVSTTAWQRRMHDNKTYSLELVELLLIRGMYQTLVKSNSEEIWQIRGELVTIGTAIGLHRDPSRWKMHRDVAERRRWAWWHIILMERWQAFLLGRPLTIASHHFDTQLPSYCDPALDKTGRLYLPNIALFRLAYILGDIMDDAVSVRPVPYESVQANDRALLRWMEELPPELDLDEFRIARSLASPNMSQLRLGVQSVIIRTSYYHIRFTLHRPLASKASAPSSNASSSGSKSSSASRDTDHIRYAESLDIAVSSADKLITMVSQARPDFLANSSLAVPGHMSWGPWHSFSAAMFFSFQLIANPDQPGAGLFRASIRKALVTLEHARGNAVADKGIDILQSLSPLYAVDYATANMTKEERVRQREQILNIVRKLAFPYHDAHDPRRSTDSPSVRGAGVASPSNSNSVSPPLTSMSSMGYDTIPGAPGPQSQSQYHNGGPHIQSPANQINPPSSLILGPGNAHNHTLHPGSSPVAGGGYHQTSYPNGLLPPPHQHPLYGDSQRYTPYVHPPEEMWGAAVGLSQGEWATFENTSNRHLQNA